MHNIEFLLKKKKEKPQNKSELLIQLGQKRAASSNRHQVQTPVPEFMNFNLNSQQTAYPSWYLHLIPTPLHNHQRRKH